MREAWTICLGVHLVLGVGGGRRVGRFSSQSCKDQNTGLAVKQTQVQTQVLALAELGDCFPVYNMEISLDLLHWLLPGLNEPIHVKLFEQCLKIVSI